MNYATTKVLRQIMWLSKLSFLVESDMLQYLFQVQSKFQNWYKWTDNRQWNEKLITPQ